MEPTWGSSGADRTQVGPMLAPWTLLSGRLYLLWVRSLNCVLYSYCNDVFNLILTHLWLMMPYGELDLDQHFVQAPIWYWFINLFFWIRFHSFKLTNWQCNLPRYFINLVYIKKPILVAQYLHTRLSNVSLAACLCRHLSGFDYKVVVIIFLTTHLA